MRAPDADVRLLERADLDRLEELSRQVGFNQTGADWTRLLALEPGGCFGVVRAGGLVATTTTTVYASRLAWVGMVVVDAAMRRLGIASRIVGHALEHLDARGVATVALDATPQGKTVYDRFGFVDQYALHRLEGVAAPVDPVRIAAARAMTEADLPAALQADAATFGVERAELLGRLLRDHPAGCSVIEEDGAPIAWSFRRPGARRWHIGPIAARDDDAAGRAFAAATAGIPGEPIVLDVPDGPRGAHLADRFGLSVARSFIRMARGAQLPAVETTRCYATAAPELG